jgi:hypothetical protein
MEQALIRTDKETLGLLKKAAGEKTVAGYIRDIAQGNIPNSKIEILLSKIIHDISVLDDDISDIQDDIAVINRALEFSPSLRKDLDASRKIAEDDERETARVGDLMLRAENIAGEKMKSSGITSWDADMLQSVVDTKGAILDDKEWVKARRDNMLQNLTELENWKKDYES